MARTHRSPGFNQGSPGTLPHTSALKRADGLHVTPHPEKVKRDALRTCRQAVPACSAAHLESIRHSAAPVSQAVRPQQFLYFLPLPQGHGSLRPTFGASRRAAGMTSSSSSPFFSVCSPWADPSCSRRGDGPPGACASCPASDPGRGGMLNGSEDKNCSKAIRLVVLRNRLDSTSFLMPPISWLNMS